jgi:predicted 3-demethylubiquinone-9 3-methyltransferase (glyoxalase superfamily)
MGERMADPQKITPCLWFDSEAEEAARFCVSVFRNARVGKISRYARKVSKSMAVLKVR